MGWVPCETSLVCTSALLNPQEELCEGGAVDFYPYLGNEDSEAQRSEATHPMSQSLGI